ncbi:unnamed protein product [Coffea canephora]|uniref:DH200=94 genomic scaffold, scaffold_996 n=1 Tax=Coffea canephora TaxID=49390 RepID=A0A068VI30_COFCA|nr:unnamed protein product [Coffea canephora]
MVNTFLDSPIQNLDWLEKNCSLASPLRDQVLTLKQKSRFLRTYLIATGISEAIPSASISLTSSFETDVAFSKAIDELSSACSLPVDLEKVDSSVSYMLENIKLWEPKIKNAYAILSEQPWRREVNSPLIDPASAMDLIDSVLENLEDILIGSTCLVSLMKKQVKILIEKLSFLRDFIGTAAKRSNIVHQEMATFLIYAHSFATKAACFSFLCWDGAQEEVMACHTNVKLSDLLQKIMPSSSDLTETFIQLLKASTPMGPGTAKTDAIASIVKLLLQNTVESLKDRFSSILEELIYLMKFLMVLPDESTGDLERILSDIRAAGREAASFQVNEVKEEQVVEMNLVLSRSLQRMKLIQAEIILIQQLDCQEVFMVSMKDKYTALHEGLKFLRSVPIDLLPEEKEEDGKLLSKHVEALQVEVISFIYSIHENNVMQDPVMETKLSLHILLLKIKLVKVDLSLMELHNHEAILVFDVKDHEIKSLHEHMEFLRTCLMGTIEVEANIEEWKLFVRHLDCVVSESSSLISSFGGSGMTEDMASELDLSIFRLLVKIKLIKAEVILIELIKTPKFGLMVHMNDEVKTLQEGVRFLRTFLINPPVEEVDQLMLAKCEAIANDAASLIFSFHEHVREEEMASEMSRSLSAFGDKIELFKAEIQDTCLQVLFSDCCQTSGTVGIFDLLDNIKDKAKSVVSVEYDIEMLVEEFEFLESLLMDTGEHYNNHQELKDLWACIKDVAWETAYIMGTGEHYNNHQELKDLWGCIKDVAWETAYITDLLVVRDNALCYFMLWIPSAVEDIKFIKAKVMEIYDEKRYAIGADSDATAGPLRIDNLVIGLDREVSNITYELTTGTKRTLIMSIVGMGGQGKTTLAQTVYNHPAVVQHFQIRAWCTVSQVYQTRELFFEILRDVMVVSNRIYDMDDDGLAGVLYKCLKQKRYFIVLDDIWDSAALDALRRSFPDDNWGSRIMLTTRKGNVASRGDWKTHIRYLNENESWHLLSRKAFGDTDLPYELRIIGKNLVKHCGGVPLLIFIVAGVLEKNKRNLSYCVELLKHLSSYHLLHGNVLLHALKIAYNSLPDHLKPCFLYLGEFPEDKEIPARKLFRLWITNGLIKETESKAPEDVAEEYLLEIVSRNLATISRRTHNGRVRGCRVHDEVRDACRSMKRGEVSLS